MPNGSDQKYNTSLDGSGDSGILLSAEETAKHGSQDDCWLIIGGKVYDVTSFISLHPGGAGEIIFYCGKEATNAFNTKNQGSPHSSNAQAMLGDYYIGDLNQKVAK
ncbi:hypothetical protein A3K63_05705 [Candidatus Micrarchaeota archaeon RBG_16_49_10]|nr:MAG: hypothetical protein A3K63_05705 [Candidatus Micrarchaeota archaeon RBG_16_49_10]